MRWILWGSVCHLPMQVDQIGSRLLNPGVLHQRLSPIKQKARGVRASGNFWRRLRHQGFRPNFVL